MYKKAFTLAEVLITLAVIGVVAALTIPTLVTKYHEKQRVTQLKKAYSVLNQAFIMAVGDYGTPDNWGLTITQTKDEEDNEIYDYTGAINISKTLTNYLNAKPLSKGTVFEKSVYSLDGRLAFENWGGKENEQWYEVGDGTIFGTGWVSILSCNPYCGDFWVVLPGGAKKIIGVDVFNFYVTRKGIIPNNHFDKYCNKNDGSDPNATMQGRGCTQWALYNDNMDYLHCDDLSWDGKHKCD